MATRNNTVPRGQAGTGAAYLLGGSRALEGWINQDQQNRKVRAYNDQQQSEYNQQVGQSYANNRLSAPVGQLWNAELQGKIAELNDVGAKYLAQGFDVYNPNFRDPKQVEAYNNFQRDRSVIQNMITAQKEFQKDFDEQDKEYRKDPYAYTQESNDARLGFEQGTSLYNAVTQGKKLPSLERVFDYNKNIREQLPKMETTSERLEGDNRVTETVPDMARIVPFANSIISSGPNRAWAEKQIGGSLDGLLKTTDESEIRKQIDAELKSPSGQDIMVELRNNGKVPAYGTPQYEKFLDDAVKEQLKAEKAYDKIVSDIVQDSIAKVNPSYKKIPDFSIEDQKMQRRAMQLREQSAMRDAVRFNERNAKDTPEDNVTYRQQWVDDMWNGVAGSGERLKAIVSGSEDYDKPLGIVENGNSLTLTIPQKISDATNGKTTRRTVTINRANPADVEKLNTIINELTGERVNSSRLNTPGGKGKVSNQLQGKQAPYKNTIKKSDIAAKASAAGYSISEYEKLLKQRGVKIQ